MDHLRTKIIINDETLVQAIQFTYIGCGISYQFSNDVEFKLAKFLQSIDTIKRTIFRKVRTETMLKIYNILVLPTFLYGPENWNLKSLTKTKNWSGRKEITETTDRLHPLWPQNKWLHTPRTTDYRHIRQDSWIQTELAFTLAKYATKPSPFEIIPLQTTRKENNWKTEEALARTVVTLETERIKGSNPWCLSWRWYIINGYYCCIVQLIHRNYYYYYYYYISNKDPLDEWDKEESSVVTGRLLLPGL